jgi:uncharacterized protein YggE
VACLREIDEIVCSRRTADLRITVSAGAQTPTGASAREPEITAIGVGETRLAPTFAVVMIAVTTRAGTAAEAASQNAAKVASTLGAVRAAGVTAENLTNQGYSVEQAYDNKGKRDGFTARNSIRAQIDGPEQAGRIIDAALAGGATDITSVQFGAPHLEEARRTAMTEAVRNARADAETLASAAGGILGRLISLTAGASLPREYGQVVQLTASLTSGSSVPTVLSPRELIVNAQATARWEFIPGPKR